MKYKKHITFLTGAGISAASGIPTYRGVGGIYKNMNDVIRLLSFNNFSNKPKEVWDFIFDLMNIVLDKK